MEDSMIFSSMEKEVHTKGNLSPGKKICVRMGIYNSCRIYFIRQNRVGLHW